jgi:hypothetical protein
MNKENRKKFNSVDLYNKICHVIIFLINNSKIFIYQFKNKVTDVFDSLDYQLYNYNEKLYNFSNNK